MLITAAILLILIGLAHSYLGEVYLLRRLFRQENLPIILGNRDVTEGVICMAWHVTTLSWIGMASILIVLQVWPQAIVQAYLWMMVAVFGTSGIVALVMGQGRHWSYVIFFSVAALCGIAAL